MKIETNMSMGNGNTRDNKSFYSYRPYYVDMKKKRAFALEENITFREALFRANEQRKLIEENDKRVKR